mgnify:CR=1 FL=1
MTNELNKLKDQSPAFIRQFYEQAKLMEISLSETEITSKVDYANSRLDTKLWTMLEKDRKKNSKMKKVKKSKGID